MPDDEYVIGPTVNNVIKAIAFELLEGMARHALPIIQAELARLREENEALKDEEIREIMEMTEPRTYTRLPERKG